MFMITMLSLKSLSILLFMCGSSLLSLCGTAAIKVGAIIDASSYSAREQQIAFEVAAQLFNVSATKLIVNDINSIFNAKNIIENWKADAIIGAGTWPKVAVVADLVSPAGTPVLSLATTLPMMKPSSRFLVQMSYEVSTTARCLAELVQSFNWRRAIIIYEEDGYGSVAGSIVTLLSDALRTVGADVDYRIAFPPSGSLPNARAMVHRELKKAQSRLCKVFIILRSSPFLISLLLKEAYTLGMTKKGYAWITDDDSTAALDSILSSSASPSSITTYLQGFIGIKPYYDDSTKQFQEFDARFRRRYKEEFVKGQKIINPGFHAVLAYDAVRTIVLAAASEKKLVDGILMGIFDGLGGRIRFRREEVVVRNGPSSLRVLDFVGRNFRESGFWTEGLGFAELESELSKGHQAVHALRPLRWPGGVRRVPGGFGELRIGVPARTTFNEFVKVEFDAKGKKIITGYCIDVFNKALKKLKYDLQYRFYPFNGTYEELVEQVAANKFDAMVGDTTILAKRSEIVDFTEPYMQSGLAKMVPLKPDRKAWVFLKPFTQALWIVIILAFTYTLVVVWFFERQGDNPEFHGPWMQQLGAALWLVFSTIFFAHKDVKSYYTKAVVVVWLFVMLVMTQSYTASLSCLLTAEKLEPLVSDHAKIGCDGDPYVLKYLQEVLHYPSKAITKVGVEDNYPKAFTNGSITAAYLETPYLRTFLSHYNNLFTVSGETLQLGGFGFVFPKGSPLTADFSKAILELSEEGVLGDLETKHFSFSFSNCPNEKKVRNLDSLTLHNLWGLFLITGGTTTLTFLLFVSRLLHERRRTSKSNVTLKERFKKILRLGKFWKKNQLELPATNPVNVGLKGSIDAITISDLHHNDDEENVRNLVPVESS